jgi:hypothetical protein
MTERMAIGFLRCGDVPADLGDRVRVFGTG